MKYRMRERLFKAMADTFEMTAWLTTSIPLGFAWMSEKARKRESRYRTLKILHRGWPSKKCQSSG